MRLARIGVLVALGQALQWGPRLTVRRRVLRVPSWFAKPENGDDVVFAVFADTNDDEDVIAIVDDKVIEALEAETMLEDDKPEDDVFEKVVEGNGIDEIFIEASPGDVQVYEEIIEGLIEEIIEDDDIEEVLIESDDPVIIDDPGAEERIEVLEEVVENSRQAEEIVKEEPFPAEDVVNDDPDVRDAETLVAEEEEEDPVAVEEPTQLERSQLRRQQVEEVVAEELAALRGQLDREVEREEERAGAVGGLMRELSEAREAKEKRIARERELLVQLQDVAQRTEEASVRESVTTAVETKANLVAIEMILVDDIDECAAQVRVEEAEIGRRLGAMRATRESLPALDDAEALRLYSWAQITELEEELRRSAVAIAETDAKVSSLRARITDALDQKQSVLLGSVPKEVVSVDLAQLDDDSLKEAAATSAAATLSAVFVLLKRCFATVGQFWTSQDSQRAGRLLTQASNATLALRSQLSDVPDSVPPSEIAAQTADQVKKVGSSFGAAIVEAGTGLGTASVETGLDEAALDVVSALSTTTAAAGILAFRAASRGAATLQDQLRNQTAK
ncbi:hypothetical protein CTAYLR_001650 [Chrysophaeum taylorii]|uniref:Uncharacterized protein n=1 Tax=Chrysophaeum taylorii TaxID=2483200 RepID=A0AAD7UCQ7_9STRA|nr:hypothetical protein CTAYLR_001650 [Chrysophaeum taylorii]